MFKGRIKWRRAPILVVQGAPAEIREWVNTGREKCTRREYSWLVGLRGGERFKLNVPERVCAKSSQAAGPGETASVSPGSESAIFQMLELMIQRQDVSSWSKLSSTSVSSHALSALGLGLEAIERIVAGGLDAGRAANEPRRLNALGHCSVLTLSL